MKRPQREPFPGGFPLSLVAPAPIDSDHAAMGIDVPTAFADPLPPNRLVVLGDSLSHGFKSFAVHETDISFPAMIARELGWDAEFRRPHYAGPEICPGLPMNIEALIRAMERNATSLPLNLVDQVATVASVLAHLKFYWEVGDGKKDPEDDRFNHNLAVWGWDIGDATSKSLGWCQDRVNSGWLSEFAHPKSLPFVAHPQERSAVRSLWGPKAIPAHEITQASAAQALGQEGDGPHGIETLIVELGANNALGAVIGMNVKWTGDDHEDLDKKAAKGYTVWQPKHFKESLDKLVTEISKVRARHVIWCTVPHVTIAPILRGVGEKPAYSRYYARYTRPWIKDEEFDPAFHPCLLGDEARAIDSAIDQYNNDIKQTVADARHAKNDWLLFDLCGLLDRLAYKRYIASPESRPYWWSSLDNPLETAPYELPRLLKGLSPRPDTRFLSGDQFGRTQGGIVAFDGVHPTTVGYGIAAHELIRVMSRAGVVFQGAADIDAIDSPVWIDEFWTRVIDSDQLLKDMPMSIGENLGLVRMLNEEFDIYRHLTGHSPV